MCAKFVYLILGGFFVFIVATVAAFVYLDWWQAILASLGTFLTLIFVAKQIVRSTFKNLRKMAEGVFTQRSEVLRGASVEVHSVRPTAMPEELRAEARRVIDGDRDPDDDDEPDETPNYDNFQWCEVELTVFPNAADVKNAAGWDIDSLVLVPIDAPKLEFLNADDSDQPEFDLLNVRIVADGNAVEPDGESLTGPRRLRFTVGAPRGTRLLKMQYFFEQFGRVELPPALGLPPAKPR